MRITVTAPSLTKPTYQTLTEYATKRFSKIKKLLKKKDQTDHELRVSVDKSGNLFDLTAEVYDGKQIIVTSQDRDIRKAVDAAKDQLKRKLRKSKEKRVDKVLNKLKPKLTFGDSNYSA